MKRKEFESVKFEESAKRKIRYNRIIPQASRSGGQRGRIPV